MSRAQQLRYSDGMNRPCWQISPRCFSTCFAIAAFFMLVAMGAVAQNAMDMGAGHDMADMQPVPPPEQLPVPIHMTGIGNSHIAIKASPEAQIWFDQGLSLLHDFWDYESAKAFEQGIRADADCAMCWWGLAQAEDFSGRGDKGYGKHALQEAVRLKDHAGAAGKLYIEALQAESKSSGPSARQDEAKDTEATMILRKLVKKYPDDLEARIFLAESVRDGYDEKGEPKSGQKEAISILEGVMKDAPNDSAANHYWIHAMEPGNHPENALKSAALLASLAPTSGHMVHMPGHIFFRVGNYVEAEHWFAASTEADERYMREQHVSVDDDWNYVHNMMYAIANLMEQGKLEEANALSDRLSVAHGKLSASLFIWSARDQMTRIGLRLPVALRVGDWDAALTMLAQSSLAQSSGGEGEKTANLRFLSEELSHYARGMLALESGDVKTAQEAGERMDAGLWRGQQDQSAKDAETKKKDEPGKDDASQADQKTEKPITEPILPDADAEPLMKTLNVASLELRAGVLSGQGKLEDAKKMYANALAAEKKLGYHEPPFYIRPIGENEAAALLRVKDYAGAKAAYESALVERPNSGFALYGLARVKELQGDTAGARESYNAFLKAWSAADASRPEVAHARSIVSGETHGTR